MINILELSTKVKNEGYSEEMAEAKLCQDIILLLLSKSKFNIFQQEVPHIIFIDGYLYRWGDELQQTIFYSQSIQRDYSNNQRIIKIKQLFIESISIN